MGQEASCRVTFGDESSDGRAQLESNELRFTGTFRLRIPFDQIKKYDAKDGSLRVVFPGGTAAFALGPQAEKWALKIRYPKGRLDKLGIKPESIVSVIGVEEEAFHDELAARTTTVSNGRARRDSNFIIFGVRDVPSLSRLPALRDSLVPDGAIWVVWTKGQKDPKAVREDDVRRVALAEGLVDVKVMSFSETHSGLKLVIPVAQRKKPAAKAPAKRATPTSAAAQTTPARPATAAKATPTKASQASPATKASAPARGRRS